MSNGNLPKKTASHGCNYRFAVLRPISLAVLSRDLAIQVLPAGRRFRPSGAIEAVVVDQDVFRQSEKAL